MFFCFDWVSFTIKPDKKSKTPYNVMLSDIFRVLSINDSSVQESFLEFDLGAKRFYDHTYSFNGITIYLTDMALSSVRNPQQQQIEKYYTYGINVEIKGTGCRYFEKLWNNHESCYEKLFIKLMELVVKGASLNICRLDMAMDWKVQQRELKEQILDLERISSAVKSKLNGSASEPIYTSLYRSTREISSVNRAARFNAETGLVESYNANGRSIYFGSFDSDSYCRFYDKKAEQETLHKDDPLYLRDELSHLESWVRFEIVFKNEVAMKIVNAYVYMEKKQFMRFFSELINRYIRFVDNDRSRVERSSVSDWWEEFIGTVEHAKIKVVGIVINEFNSAFKWTLRCSNTFSAIIDNIGVDAFITAILNAADPDQYTAKHRRIASSPSRTEEVYTNLDIWYNNIPMVDYDS